MDRTITLLVLQRLPVYDIVHSISAVCIQWHSLLGMKLFSIFWCFTSSLSLYSNARYRDRGTMERHVYTFSPVLCFSSRCKYSSQRAIQKAISNMAQYLLYMLFILLLICRLFDFIYICKGASAPERLFHLVNTGTYCMLLTSKTPPLPLCSFWNLE